MIGLLLLAGGLWRGSVLIALVGVLVAAPVPVVGAGLLAWAIWARVGRRPSRHGPVIADLALGVASELRTGQSVPAALHSAAVRVPALDLRRTIRRIAAGRPSLEVSQELEAAVPEMGRALSAAYRLAATSGARSAAVFTRLAVLAEEHEEERREARVQSTQARVSAVVVAVAPLVLLAVMGAGGLLEPLTGAGFTGVAILGAGLLPIAVGVMAVWAMSRRALR